MVEAAPRIYLDHAATTPMRPETIAAWTEAAHALNPGGYYASGRAAQSLLDTARETIARHLGCEPIEVIFTASGTESDNIAIRGLYRTRTAANPELTRIVTSPIEHPAVAEPVKELAAAGAEITTLAVGSDGIVVLSDAVAAALDEPAALATLMLANNETGAIQPVRELAQRVQAQGTPVHVDAVQAVGHIPVNFQELGVTTLAVSAHKFGGPRSSGILLAKRSPAPQPIATGGGQERGIRPGTVDVASAYATAMALDAAVGEIEQVQGRIARYRDELRDQLLTTIPNTILHTPRDNQALPGHLHFSVPGAEADSLLMLCDAAGFEVATGSACARGVNRASDVLLAMGCDDDAARNVLRLTIGPEFTDADLQRVVTQLPDLIAKARLAAAW